MPDSTRSFLLEFAFDTRARPMANGSVEAVEEIYPLQMALTQKGPLGSAGSAAALFTRFLYRTDTNEGDRIEFRFLDITGIETAAGSVPSSANLHSFEMYSYIPVQGTSSFPFTSAHGGQSIQGSSGFEYGGLQLGSSGLEASVGFATLATDTYPTWSLGGGADFVIDQVGTVEMSFALGVTLADGSTRKFVVDPMLIISPDERP